MAVVNDKKKITGGGSASSGGGSASAPAIGGVKLNSNGTVTVATGSVPSSVQNGLQNAQQVLTNSINTAAKTTQPAATALTSGITNLPAQTSAANNGYNGLQGISSNTAQKIAQTQEYQQSPIVTEALNTLQSVLDQKPKSYESKYSGALESILQQIQNPEKFTYSFNGDELFKSYADLYTQQGKQASLDAQGQAAALTGGYGNSYGQQVGQQTYQQYLQNLYDKGIDLYDRAYQRYMDEQNGLYNQFNVLSQADNTDYGRYRDTVGDWRNDVNYYTDWYNTQSDRDYSRYGDQRDFTWNMGLAENSDWWTGRNFDETVRMNNEQIRMNDEQIRQWNEDFGYRQKTDAQKNAMDICTAILANGQMPSSTQLKAAGLSKSDAKKMMAQVTTGGGGGGRGGSGGGSANTYYDPNTDQYFYMDNNGKVKSYKNLDDLPDDASISDKEEIKKKVAEATGANLAKTMVWY